MPFLEISHLKKQFTTGQNLLEVLSDLSFSIEAGEFVTILGASGCGKTTFLRCVGGFETPTSGEVLLKGQKVLKPGPRISMVFQTFDQLFPWKTVYQNVYVAAKANNMSTTKTQHREMVMEYLDMVGLSGFTDYYPHQLSGGMKQRVAIARSLVLESEVILMDEPFGSIDAQNRTILQAEMLRIWEKTKVTILFVTHNIMEAIVLGSRIILFGNPPNNIQMVLDNNIPYDAGNVRTLDAPGFTEMWTELREGLYKGSGLEKGKKQVSPE